MNEQHIEPGLLNLFRLINYVWLGLATLGMLEVLTTPTPTSLAIGRLGSFVHIVVILAYLYARPLQRRLGRYYLPIGLTITTVWAALNRWVEMALRLDAGWPDGAIYDDEMGLFVPLFVPMVIVTAQYGYRAMLTYLLATVVLQLSLANLLFPLTDLPPRMVEDDVLGRAFLYPLAAFLVVRLVAGQKEERAVLANRNRRLTQYATTIEQLATSQERNRMARELHDTLAHTLSAVSIQLEALNKQLDTDLEGARRTLKQARMSVRNGLSETRRALQALRASPLEDQGLLIAMRHLVDTAAERSGLHIMLHLPAAIEGLTPQAEHSIYRITEEALNNTIRHARANTAHVSLTYTPPLLRLCVQDDGIGFEPHRKFVDGHYGLIGMQERAMLCNGHLHVDSTPQRGTTISLDLEV